MAGLALEQHPERTRLFMAWKQMGWPVAWDPFDVLGLGVVPVVWLLDEAGIIRAVDPPREDPAALDRWIRERPMTIPLHPEDPPVPRPAPGRSLLEVARKLALWDGNERLDEAIQVAEEATEQAEGGEASFTAGVIYRMRYDSDRRRPGDFGRAIRHWERALQADPNNYVWRRRLQQYGPRPAKPYPFYDWVPRARAEISWRGEVPEAVGPLTRSELAQPTPELEPVPSGGEPDPGGRIHRDRGELVRAEAVAVPGRVPPGEAVRVHLEFQPTDGAHWNNEVDPPLVWVEVPEGWEAEGRSFILPSPEEPLSEETRRVDFEVRPPPDTAGRFHVSAYALYYVCEDRDGACIYRRQDVTASIEVTEEGGVGLKG